MRVVVGYARWHWRVAHLSAGRLWLKCWKDAYYWFKTCPGVVQVTKQKPGEDDPWWVVTFCFEDGSCVDLYEGEWTMLKYIKAAERAAEGEPRSLQLEDKWLWEKRPALREYMTSSEAPGGGVREPSVLMVCPSDEGFKVGLKDEDSGGWLWRLGDTLSKALDAVEQALAGGTARFGGKKGSKGSKGPKGG